MNKGKAFEYLVKYILINVGFEEVSSDDKYIFDSAAGQMINGLGEAHNADVLLEPPVQIPFFAKTRLLIECKNHESNKVGLDIIRSVLALREDINSFDILDKKELERRKNQNRRDFVSYSRYMYSVAVASTNGFTSQAQSLAATYRIPLIEFNNYPFWAAWEKELEKLKNNANGIDRKDIEKFASEICRGMAVAITNTGQLLFLFYSNKRKCFPSNRYEIHRTKIGEPWALNCGGEEYRFCLPENLIDHWIDEETKTESIINYKKQNMARMIVYYKDNGGSKIHMLAIERDGLSKIRS